MERKNKIKYFALILAFVLITTVLISCTANDNQEEKLTIITTIFPQYDFARQLAGDNVSITILLAPGIESHTYEPTPIDMKKINDADIFIYTGAEMEPWAEEIVSSVDNNSLIVVDASKNIDHFIEEHGHEDGDHEHDPHIWLDPQNAIVMVNNILDALIEADSKNADTYEKNAEAYIKKLQKLDSDIQDAVDSSNKNTIVFGGRFAYAYFVERYGIDYVSAYDSCSTHDEPSVQSIVDIVDFIKENGIKYIYHEELVDPKVAQSIAEQTGVELLLMHTVHNLSYDDMDAGKTYIDIMYANLENLKKGLE